MRYRHTDQSIGEYFAECDLQRRKVESEMGAVAGRPEQFVSILRMINAGLYSQEESLLMVGSRKSLKFEKA